MLVEELNGMETAAVDVEVDVTAIKIWSAGFPDFRFGMYSLDGFPNGLPDAYTLYAHLHIEESQFAVVGFMIDSDNGTSLSLTISINCFISFSIFCIQRLIEILIGQNLPLVVTFFAWEMRLKSMLECLLHLLFECDGLFFS